MQPRIVEATPTAATAPEPPTGAATRREFAATVLAAGAAALLLPACASGSGASAANAAATAAAPTAAEPTAAVAEALLSAVVARHGRWLDSQGERTNVRQAIERNLRHADRMRATALPNAVDPYSVCYAPAAPPR